MSDAMPQANPGNVAVARIGLRWGAWFWTPCVLVAVFAILASANHAPGAPAAWQIALWLLPPLLVLMVCGRWWATRGLRVGEWTLLVATIVQGLVLFGVTVLLPFALVMRGETSPAWSSADVTPFATGWGICSAWMLLLATLVGWRVRRAELRASRSAAGATVTPGIASDIAIATPESPPGAARPFAHDLFSSIGIPLLLAVPFVAVLSYDAHQRHAANTLLQRQITDDVEPRIADLKDLNRVKSTVLVREQMLRVMEPDAASAGDALAAAFALPAGVQLVSMRTRGEFLALDARCAVPDAEQSLQAFLLQSGYRDVRVVSHQHQGDDPIDVVSIEATSSRGDAP